jgi:GntR family transcriptional regulator/MocR family aminotransferase
MRSSAKDLALGFEAPRDGESRSKWLYKELRGAILSGRLRRGAQIPASRDMALQYGLSRGTVVTVFEQLMAEGYLEGRRGAGTFVSERMPDDLQPPAASKKPAAGAIKSLARFAPGPPRAFRVNEPALDHFPMGLWARIGSRRLHRASRLLLASGDPRGYPPLREAIARYLGASRGVHCEADQVVVLSGTQQGLDLLARLVLKSGDTVWMENPGYPGAFAAFRNAGARLIPVSIDERGLNPADGVRRDPRAKLLYTTPAHQFPLGMALPLDRRLELLDRARRMKALVIEDDYDSEFRYEGRPLPALQGLDAGNTVVFLGSFNKALFPSLRIGYAVLPPNLVESFAELRFHADRYTPQLDQAILCDFITEGHFTRHLRRMRALYESRLHALREAIKRRLDGVMSIPDIGAGLQTTAIFSAKTDSAKVEAAAAALGLETIGLHRFCLQRIQTSGLMLGFAAIDEREIGRGVNVLAQVFETLDRRFLT